MPRFIPLLLVSAAALAAVLPPKTFAQAASAPAADDEALRNIQSNFARMAPPPRTMQSINQDLQKNRKPSGKRPDGGPRDAAGNHRRPTRPTPARTANRPPRQTARRHPMHRLPMGRRPQPTRKPAGRANADSSLRWQAIHLGVPNRRNL